MIPDNQHTIYYLDFDCNLIDVTKIERSEQNLSLGGFIDIFDVYTLNGEIVAFKSNHLKR